MRIMQQTVVAKLRILGLPLVAAALLVAAISSAHAAGADHPHHLAVVGGYATKSSGKEAAFVGIEYEYRLSDLWGIGGYAETTWGDFDLEALGLIATLHPGGGWKVLGGLGIERKLGTKKDKLLGRLGVGYDFHVGSFSIGPLIAVDFIEDFSEVYYLGLAAGVGF